MTLSAKIILSFLLPLFVIQNGFGQKLNVTIKGNIKLLKQTDRDVDQCCFHYSDVLTGKPVVVPIRRDTAGNYTVSFELEHYEQIYFSKAINYKGQEIYDTGMTYFSFFDKPGQTMQVNYVQRPYSLTFGGDFSKENNQYNAYTKQFNRGVKNIYSEFFDKELSPEEVKEMGLQSFKEQLTFNKKYFNEHPTSSFVQQQAYFNTLYKTQHAVISYNFHNKNHETLAMINDFYQALNITGHTFKDAPKGTLSNITDPNPSLKNAAALGNRDYKSFLSSYFGTLQANLKFDTVETVLFTDIAKYIHDKHPELNKADSLLVERFFINDTLHTKYTKYEKKTMSAITNRYANEFLEIRHNRAELNKYLAITDPELRDVGATIAMYKNLDLNHIESLGPIIDAYKKGVKNTYLKNKFLAEYADKLDQLHHSKISALSILNSSDGLTGSDLLKKLLEKYKGKVVYVDVWATWCGPCIAGMGPSQTLRGKLKGRGVVFLYLCLDSPDKSAWKNVIAAKNIEGENYFFDHRQSSMIYKELDVKYIPHYALVDKNGNLMNKDAGAPLEPKTLEQINSLLMN
ncbi:MAG TPA: TlpA disulfide reductase family protein [Mucilaginibacter sp.]|jgi:thiol-disulfide isomerase/thioredoxin|nr:TlpA disulfide reductase family protein [Mucilaginibacter sp.]